MLKRNDRGETMVRRLIGFLFILLVLAAVALIGYAYFVDLPAVTGQIETPATGVGFGD
ncbi:hypothetical protein [Pikeienuella sp. HZG-20]|uniref:hypothetical protein n=1 Tax=Paludibacillus litoralis TaxID=3133267 RepID=UPI0030ED6CD1